MPICEGRDTKSDAGGVAVETFPKTNLEWDTPRRSRKQPGAAYVPKIRSRLAFPKMANCRRRNGKDRAERMAVMGRPDRQPERPIVGGSGMAGIGGKRPGRYRSAIGVSSRSFI